MVRSYTIMPVGNARGENMSAKRSVDFNALRHDQGELRFGLPSGLISPSRTTFSGCNLSTKLKKFARLM